MGPSYAAVHAAVASRLSPGALAHSERVAQTAADLAVRYGVDVEHARLAGLLHDWHRELPRAELLSRASVSGVPVTRVDEAVPYLLHGPVAAVDLADEYPDIDSAVLEAVAAHTYGNETMSPLAMVVYIADVIEPGRDHKSADRLRQEVGAASLPELFADTYAASLKHLIKRRRRIHPTTVAVWNALIAEDAR